MTQYFSKKKELIDSMMVKKPEYADILSFYGTICELQSSASPRLYLKPLVADKALTDITEREGFPLINKDEFVIDLAAATSLFEAICDAGLHANEKMHTTIRILEDAFAVNALRRQDLLLRHADDAFLDSVIRDFTIDGSILKLLIHMSIFPSLRAHVELLKDRLNLKKWFRGYCPICGSSPYLSQLKDEGHRYLLCSFCGFEWPSERLKCPFCENADHTKLHYFYAEGDEAHRIDLCDTCKQYIKTVDSRKLAYAPDPELEDIVTIHLDILASEKGYQKPVASPWGV